MEILAIVSFTAIFITGIIWATSQHADSSH